MSFKTILLGFSLGASAYYAYENRKAIQQEFTDTKATVTQAQDSFQAIKSNLTKLQDQIPLLQELSSDFNHKLRVFNQETQSRVEIINQRMEHLQAQTTKLNENLAQYQTKTSDNN
ncbi:hypothetical protein ACVR05_04830 [Streptococcus caprae]|uniref:Chemotaxis protein n=1 Tax=Streptococcus caprae TaxID=1640501 RepID=A0ABV8CTK1_9STRE